MISFLLMLYCRSKLSGSAISSMQTLLLLCAGRRRLSTRNCNFIINTRGQFFNLIKWIWWMAVGRSFLQWSQEARWSTRCFVFFKMASFWFDSALAEWRMMVVQQIYPWHKPWVNLFDICCPQCNERNNFYFILISWRFISICLNNCILF